MMEEDILPQSHEETVLVQIPESAIVNFNNIICRLCANPNERIIGIYSEEGLSNQLPTKMNLYLPVKVSENDTLPLQCCWSCASTVLAWHELVVASVEADRRLRGLEITSDKHNVEDDFVERDEPNSPSDMPDNRSEQKFPAVSLSVFCQEATSAAMQQKSMQPLKEVKVETATSCVQQQQDEIKKEEWIQCDDISNESLQKYIETMQQNSFVDTKILEATTAEKMKVLRGRRLRVVKSVHIVKSSSIRQQEQNNFFDSECEKDKPGSDNLYDILEESGKPEEDYNFSCQFCSMMFVNEDDIINHVKQKHSEKHCGLINKKFNKRDRRKNTKLDHEAVNAAKVVVEGRIYYNCKICGKSLHSPYTYIWHMRIHTGERPYVCDLCGKQFRVSQGLVRHLRETHEGIKNFGCDICGRMFATRRNVEEHRRIHTNERPYICDLCGKSFKQKASLFVHNRSHTDSFPFRCSYCNQGFRTRPPLLIHVTRHTGEKPYPCDVCGRCFRIKYELKRHKLIHSEEKPFSCSECGLSFRQKRYLRNHNKINHNRTTL